MALAVERFGSLDVLRRRGAAPGGGAGCPLGRVGTPEGIAAAVAYPASADASWVTG
ncbi:hypothetical protein [Streptomyces sp. RPT161]|uniref:hypothetical protein n=1 Tax=Streptomyces sp. RPT161 TaxID=3015993 RepID=UPI002FCE9BFF